MKVIREKNAKEALNAHALGHDQELDHPRMNIYGQTLSDQRL